MGDTLQFLGAAGTVTGSKFLLSLRGQRIMVDAGLFQGAKALRLRNRSAFPADPREIRAVLLTHAHLDHSGYLPLLVKQGFRGPIYCSAPTRDLTEIILLDSAKIQEEDAERANAGHYSKHFPARPLYDVEDARRAIDLLEARKPGTWHALPKGVDFRFTGSGHILGSSLIEVRSPDKVVAFTGDLGRAHPLTLPPAEAIARADYVVTESTYGDRMHPSSSPQLEIRRIVRETAGRGGQLIIPSFAIGRTQDVLYLLTRLQREKEIPEIPIFLDSPMGISATDILRRYPDWHRLSSTEIEDLEHVVTRVHTRQESDALRHRTESAIVIAGSGMLAGGRILNHLVDRLPDARNTVLLTGFQAASTRGSLLRSGIGELKIHGRYIPVRARTEEISTLSAHADQAELIAWLGRFEAPPRRAFVVHGETQAAEALRVKIRDTLGWNVVIPDQDQIFEL